MEPIAPGQTRFRIYGLDPDGDEPLSGSLFANKLGTFIRALKEADRAANNGKLVHDYKIAKLESSDPTVTLIETVEPRYEGLLPHRSGITGFEDCADAIIIGDENRARRYGKCVDHIRRLAGGAHRSYGHGEIWTRPDPEHVTRIDEFLAERSEAMLHPEIVQPIPGGPAEYKGVVEDGSFDGIIKVVDLRGERPAITLILSAGEKQIDCICRPEHLEDIRRNLDARVHVYGRAIYDGRIPLPRRVEVRQIEPLGERGDFLRWRGAFEPFEPSDWDVGEA